MPSTPKIAAVCCTYLRPKQLGHLIRCFERQDYPLQRRELVILDDAGQYDDEQGDGWRLRSVARRFPTLGEKRNEAVRMVADDCEAIAVWDDDDLYLPWALRASAAALNEAPWSRPSLVLHRQKDGRLTQHRTGGLFHGGWAFRRSVFEQVGGYPAANNGEDQALAERFRRAGVHQTDPCRLGFKPFYIYRWGGGWHVSAMGSNGYRQLGNLRGEPTALTIADPPDVDLLRPRILPGVHARRF